MRLWALVCTLPGGGTFLWCEPYLAPELAQQALAEVPDRYTPRVAEFVEAPTDRAPAPSAADDGAIHGPNGGGC